MASSRELDSFVITSEDGVRRSFSVVEYITPDDLVLIGANAIASEIKYEYEYQSILKTDLLDFLIRVNLPRPR